MQLLLVGLIAWFSAQLVKFAIRALNETPDWRLFYRSGGMPSAHSATVVSVTVALLALEGPASPLFGLAAILAVIVIYDSLGVRRASGDHSVVLNVIIKAVGGAKPIRELLGHTPKEVAAGSLLGVVVGGAATFKSWSPHAGFLTSPPLDLERFVYLGIFGAILISAGILRLLLGRFRKVAVIKKLKSLIWWALVTPATIGMFLSLLHFQIRGPGSWRLWALLLLVGFTVWHIWLTWGFYRHAPRQYREEKSQLLRRRKASRKTSKRKKRKR